jgi:hypothetical protein
MSPFAVAAEQAAVYLFTHREQVNAVILGIEDLMKDAPGDSKAASFRGYLGAMLGMETQIDQAWPIVAPFFNAIVAKAKAPPAAPAA